jgi:hypothetical protein
MALFLLLAVSSHTLWIILIRIAISFFPLIKNSYNNVTNHVCLYLITITVTNPMRNCFVNSATSTNPNCTFNDTMWQSDSSLLIG